MSVNSHPQEVVNIAGSQEAGLLHRPMHRLTEAKLERNQAVSSTYRGTFSVGANTPPGLDIDFSSLADVKHVYIHHITISS